MSSTAMPVKHISFGSLLATVFTTHFRSTLLSRKTLILLIVNLLPLIGAILYLTSDAKSGLTFYRGMIEYVTITFLLPLTAMFFGGPAIVEEIEGRTITYLFLRPVSKPAIFLGKLLAAASVVAILVVLPVIPTYFVSAAAGDPGDDGIRLMTQTLVSLTVGSLSYTAVFACLSAVFARSLLASILFWGVFEWALSFVPVLEVGTQKYHIRNAGSLIDLGNFGMLDKMVGLEKPIELPIAASYGALIGIAVLAAALGSVIFSRRQYVI